MKAFVLTVFLAAAVLAEAFQPVRKRHKILISRRLKKYRQKQDVGTPLSLDYDSERSLLQSTVCMSELNQQRANNGKSPVQFQSQA